MEDALLSPYALFTALISDGDPKFDVVMAFNQRNAVELFAKHHYKDAKVTITEKSENVFAINFGSNRLNFDFVVVKIDVSKQGVFEIPKDMHK